MMVLVVVCAATLALGFVTLRPRRRPDAVMSRLGPYRSLPRPGAGCWTCELPEAGPHLSGVPPDAGHPGWDALLRDVRGEP